MLATVPTVPAADDAEPSAEEIQALVRYSHSLESIDLNGLLRSSANGARIPFGLSIRGNIIQFGFAEPPETLTLIQKDGGCELTRTTEADGNDRLPDSRLSEPVRGTDVTYEDLAMRFLYWPDARRVGEEIIKNRVAWKLHIINPRRSGPYSQVIIWVDRASGGLMKMEGYDWGDIDNKARRIKMYEVVSGQKIDGAWIIKKMNIESFDAASGKMTSRTTLELRERK